MSNYNSNSTDKYILYLDSISLSRFYEILTDIDAMEISETGDMDLLEAYERAKTEGVHVSEVLPYGTELAIRDSYLHELLSAEMLKDGFEPVRVSTDGDFGFDSSDDVRLSDDIDFSDETPLFDDSSLRETNDAEFESLMSLLMDDSDLELDLDDTIIEESSDDLAKTADTDDFGFSDLDLSAFAEAEQVFSDGEDPDLTQKDSLLAGGDTDIDFSEIDVSQFNFDDEELADTEKTVDALADDQTVFASTVTESYADKTEDESRVISGEDVLPLIYALNAIKHSLTVGVSDTLAEMEELLAGFGVGEDESGKKPEVEEEKPESEEVRAFAEELSSMSAFDFEELDSKVFGGSEEKTADTVSPASASEDSFDYSALSGMLNSDTTATVSEEVSEKVFDTPDPAPVAAAPLSSTGKKKKEKKSKKSKKGKKSSTTGDIYDDYAGFIDEMINTTGMREAVLENEKISAMISAFSARLRDHSTFFSRNDMCNAVIDIISELNAFCESRGVYGIYISYPETSVSTLYNEYERRYNLASSAALKAQRDLDAMLEEKKKRAELLKDEYDEKTPPIEFPDPDIPGEQHKFIFGPSEISDMPGNELIYQRFGYKRAYFAGEFDCDLLLDLKTGDKIGVIPMLRLSHVWYKVPFDQGSDEFKCGMTKKEWDSAYNRLKIHLKKKIADDPKHPEHVLVQDVLSLSENVYRELFILNSTKVIELIRAAILADIAENERLLDKWKRIKRYKKKIPLAKESGGIFSKNDVKVLEKRDIRYLNDIRDYDVYTLKNLLLEHSFANIIKEINEAIREHKAQKKDRILARRPYIIGFPALILTAIVAYVMKYKLIKSATETNVINVATVIFLLSFVTVLYAIVRTFVRRRKNPSYTYLVPKIRKRFALMILCAIFTLGSVFVFYQRYDGYDDVLYYRDLDDGNIAVAGIVDKDQTDLRIPAHIDGKEVTEIDVGAFRKKDLKEVIIPGTVSKIDDLAFYKCSSLASIKVFNDLYYDAPFDDYNAELNITEIGRLAFAKCSSLYEANVTEGVETLGVRAFADCTRLTDVDISSVSTFGKSAFSGCTSLKSVTIGENTTSIPKKAFELCASLTAVNGFAYVTEILDESFSGCVSLDSIDFSNIKFIGKRAFASCYSISELILPATLEHVGKYAFHGCNRISYAVLPFIGESRENPKNTSLTYLFDCKDEYSTKIHVVLTDMETIVGNTFKNCAAVYKVTLPPNVMKIETGAFNGSGITEFEIPDSFTVLPEKLFQGCDELVTISGGKNVQKIEQGVFRKCSSLSAVDFPLVESIGEGAFADCTALTSIGQTPMLRFVAAGAFENCNSLVSIDFSSVEGALEAEIFKDCYQLNTVILPRTLTVLPEGIFDGCSALNELDLPETVEVIGKHAFRNSGIASLNIGTNVKEIGAGAFLSCSRIEQVVIPENVVKIGRRAFADCYNLSTVEIPFLGSARDSSLTGFKYVFGKDTSIEEVTVSGIETLHFMTLKGADGVEVLTVKNGLKKISFGALAFNDSLTHVTLPETLETIGAHAFNSCDNLEIVDLSATKVTEIGKSAFRSCGSLKTVTLPETLELLPDSIFRNSYYMTEMTLPEGIKEIGKNAFRGSIALTQLTLPESLERIGDKAFYGCTSLDSLTIPQNTQFIGKKILGGCNDLDTLTIPFIGESVSSPDTISYVTDSYYLNSITVTAAKTLAADTFASCRNLEILTLNEDIRKIGEGVVDGCVNLDRVIMPTEEMFDRFSRFFKGIDVYSPSGEKYVEKIEEDIWGDYDAGDNEEGPTDNNVDAPSDDNALDPLPFG